MFIHNEIMTNDYLLLYYEKLQTYDLIYDEINSIFHS